MEPIPTRNKVAKFLAAVVVLIIVAALLTGCQSTDKSITTKAMNMQYKCSTPVTVEDAMSLKDFAKQTLPTDKDWTNNDSFLEEELAASNWASVIVMRTGKAFSGKIKAGTVMQVPSTCK